MTVTSRHSLLLLLALGFAITRGTPCAAQADAPSGSNQVSLIIRYSDDEGPSMWVKTRGGDDVTYTTSSVFVKCRDEKQVGMIVHKEIKDNKKTLLLKAHMCNLGNDKSIVYAENGEPIPISYDDGLELYRKNESGKNIKLKSGGIVPAGKHKITVFHAD